MKKFFTQPIGELSRQNALFFLVINIVFIGAELSGTTALDAVEDLLNFFWGFSLLSIVIAGYYLAEGHVPEYWNCLLYTSPSPRDGLLSRMPSSS